MKKLGYSGTEVEISIPDGESMARKTFNPLKADRLPGAILGTNGRVEPMSEQALIDTIRLRFR